MQSVFRNYLNLTGIAGKFPVLDGLRALAILLVLFRHAVIPFYDDLLSGATRELETLLTIMHNGWMGVDLFFVLSGFLVSYHILQRMPSTNTLQFIRRYWLKRVLRTFPVYFGIIIIVLLGFIPLYDAPTNAPLLEFVIHVFFLQDYLGERILIPLWSLATEEKFYFLAPFLLLGLRKVESHKVQLITLVCLSLIPLALRLHASATLPITSYADFFWAVRAPFHMVFDGLLLGSICGYIQHHKLFSSFLSAYGPLLAGFGAAVVCGIAALKPWMISGEWSSVAIILYVLAFSFAMIVIGSLHVREESLRVLKNRFLLTISRLSYSLYVVHFALIPLSLYLTATLFTTTSSLATFMIFLPVYLGLSTTFAIVLHMIIEKPFLILKDRL